MGINYACKKINLIKVSEFDQIYELELNTFETILFKVIIKEKSILLNTSLLNISLVKARTNMLLWALITLI